ncbi:MAG: hypothetical protein R3E60_01195 [Alphaproteobacteria bacterium]
MASSIKGSKILLIIILITLFTLALGRVLYVNFDQKNVYIIDAKNYLPEEKVEISTKYYFKTNYNIFCFITSYFEFKKDDIDDNYIKNVIKYQGALPYTFSTDENEWGLMLVNDDKIGIMKFKKNIIYPNKNIIDSIKKMENRDNSSLVCSFLEKNKNLIIQLRKIEDRYEVMHFSIS